MPTKTTWQKYQEILSSPRFHQVLFVAFLQVLRYYNILDDFAANLLSGILAASIGIGTADKVGSSPLVIEKIVTVTEPTPETQTEQAKNIIDNY